jgi:hypothetical protein
MPRHLATTAVAALAAPGLAALPRFLHLFGELQLKPCGWEMDDFP